MNVGMDMCMNTVYTSIPGFPEQLGMVWMGDMVMESPPELVLDPRQGEPSFFSHGSPYNDIRNHHIASTMVRYIPQQFSNECSEPDEAMEAVDAHEIQRVSFVFGDGTNPIFTRVFLTLRFLYFSRITIHNLKGRR